MEYGIDYIGGMNYLDVIERHHPKGYAGGCLVKASGWKTGIKTVKTLAEHPDCPIIRVHGIWKDNHTFTQKDIDPAVKIAKRVAKVAEKFPDKQFYFSPWLEHRADAKLWNECRKQVFDVLPKEIKIVSSGEKTQRAIAERHGSYISSKREIFSFDGVDILSTPANLNIYLKAHSHAKLFFLWCPACNGRKTLRDTTERSQRSAYLTKQHINKMVKKVEAI